MNVREWSPMVVIKITHPSLNSPPYVSRLLANLELILTSFVDEY